MKSPQAPNETSPINPQHSSTHPGGSSPLQSVLNMLKICIGTGTLALPYAVSQGGLMTGAIGLGFIALWNYYASVRLDNLREWTGQHTYANIVNHVFGEKCKLFVNICTISTLLGVCIVYTITFASLFHETPLAFLAYDKSTWREILLCGAIVIPLVCAPHLKFFSVSSAIGLIALAVGFGSIFVYGINTYGGDTCETSSIWGTSVAHFADWFGIAAFCFGIPPIQFSISEAMAEPEKFTSVLAYALTIVWVFYIFCGVGSAWLFRCTEISENILSNLPDGSVFATILRLACCAVALTSYPLCLVPAAEMIASVGSETNYEEDDERRPGVPLRIGLVALCTSVAMVVPDFGLMVSIIGNFSVSMVSFVLPSAMSLACAHRQEAYLPIDTPQQLPKLPFRSAWYYVDMVLLVVGVITCAITTFLTLSSAFSPQTPPMPPPPLGHT